ncbi:EcoRII N-terminal effector-binding domain-containing protein [Ferruginibacter profundus]
MNQELQSAIDAVKANQYSFCKFISSNDAGATGAHQAGLYIPKNSIDLIFDEPGKIGENKEKFANIEWTDGTIANCRFIYYGQGTRNEYRITRLGKSFNVGELVIIVKKNEAQYLGFLLQTESDKIGFLGKFNLEEKDTNKLIEKNNSHPVVPINSIMSNETSSQVETHEINFKPKAHILVLLGEELIKSPVMAIYELIKNGYDADAKTIDVTFHEIENIDNAWIEIKDNGTGISEDVLQNVWFEPGTDFRKPMNESGKRAIKRSPIYNRIPMGEKGVGRFAVHKLGNKIKLISRPSKVIVDANGNNLKNEMLNYELTVDIDWRKFSQSKYLDDVIIEWGKNYDQNTFLFKESSGTFIQIDSLKEEWTRGMARQLKRQTLSMLSPKNDSNKFSINLDFGNWWLNNIPETTSLLKIAPYKLTVFVDKDYNMTFDYDFKLINNKELGDRSINKKTENLTDRKKYEYNIKGELKPFFRDALELLEYDKPAIENIIYEFDIAELPYGNLMIELFSYDLDSDSLRDITTSPKLIRDLLKDHSGIKVFKGDLRVYDYGDPGDDWLGLDIKRVNNKEWFSNNQIIGYVYLDAETSGSLIEKTNREGFINNYAYDNLTVVLDFILSAFMAERQSDRQRWLQFNKKGNTQNTFANQLTGFKELITSSGIDENSQALLLEEANRVEEKYEQDKNALLIPAGVGMTASFAMHEIEKLIPRMQESVKENPLNKFKLTTQVEELKDYSEGLLSVLKKSSNIAIPVLECVNQALNNYSSRINSRNIQIDTDYDDNIGEIICDKRLFITILMNIIDNSIYWLDTTFKNFKGIYISIRKLEKGISIIIADNGPGFKEKVEDIIRPYYSRKKNGIGIGMYLVDTVMIQYGRLNFLFDKEYLLSKGIPEKYKGAVVELIFNKNQN